MKPVMMKLVTQSYLGVERALLLVPLLLPRRGVVVAREVLVLDLLLLQERDLALVLPERLERLRSRRSP